MNHPSNNDAPPESLLRLQRQFAGHLRDPESVSAPEGVEDRRMAIYRRLFFGNLRNLMAKNFPVLRRLVDDDGWDRLIRQFMVAHRAQTPMFTEIGSEFVRFIEQQRPDDLPPFATELVHWEYLETVVRLHEADLAAVAADPDSDLLARAPTLNPTMQLGIYRWPVHQIGPEFQPDAPLPSPIVLAACRKRDHRIGFMRFNPVTARLVERIGEHENQSGREHLLAIAGELGAPDPEAIVQSGAAMLEKLRAGEFVLGTTGQD
ncbi:putative DNA-binding domain-containing protein [Wenzhouxiangella sp. AB-CW3]|uniref:HvfC family RiPP maturation protein n=1 Tax=Wenzhouxiangella sp. AB-CW3 TaxID=2771012 RepID=UPI00168BF2E0|nr:putative DNA-binding domain-containing protein [Wenzhouxiangella sp. AB-CW3]QOC21502.1 putative DNA-binding domain-containing protein [Wenzhouxiangella sp. AB-CW3]